MNETPKKKRWPWVLLAIVLVLLLLVSSAWMFYQSKLNKLDFDDGKQEIDTTVEMPLDDMDIPDLGEAPENADELDDAPEDEIYHDDDVMNILLLGTDERSKKFNTNARADSIMLLSLNMRDHTIKLVSIERGIGVPVPGRNDDWITHTFRYGGADLTLQTVREQFRVDVDRYIRVNFSAFTQGIDAIGGVDLNFTAEEIAYLNEGCPELRSNPLSLGVNHVNGNIALNYARLREIDSDWKRIQRQRNVVQAALNQVAHSDLLTLNKLADTILPTIKTNLTKSEITDLLLEVPAFLAKGIQMEQMTIPTRDTCWNSVGVDGRKLIGVDFAANAKILKEFFYGITD